MAELVRGTIADRPWGRTLGRLALRQLTGQLTIESDGKQYAIAFAGGAVVAAYSPLAADSIARVAMTSHLISSTHVPTITKRIAAHPGRDEVEILAEIANLSTEQALKLRCKLVAQRAARTFALEHGEFVVDDEITLPTAAGCALDIRPIIYMGVKNVSEVRLSSDLRDLGSFFVLPAEADADLPRFEFSNQERPILEALRAGTSLPELEATHREIEPRTAAAVIYALVSCEAMAAQPPVARTTTASAAAAPIETVAPPTSTPFRRAPSFADTSMPSVTFARTPRPNQADPVVPSKRTSSPTLPAFSRTSSSSPPAARTPTQPPPARTHTPTAPIHSRTTSQPRPRTPEAPVISRTASGTAISRTSSASGPTVSRTPTLPRTPTPRDPSPPRTPTLPRTTTPHRSAAEVRVQLVTGLTNLEKDADYFTLLGVPFDAPLDAIRAAYLELARSLHPERLPVLTQDETRDASRLFLQVNIAFGVLTDPVKREEYVVARRPRAVTASVPPPFLAESSDPADLAKAAAKRGEAALRREDMQEAVVELAKAVELAPFDADYAAVLAWARFCAATDRVKVAVESRKVLEKAVLKAAKPLVARLYLGRMERMLGRDRDALRQFQEILDEQPNHPDAAAEVRAIEQRLSASRR